MFDRELSLHREWGEDLERCREADVPEGITTVAKPTLAKRMLKRAFASGVRAAWVTGDTVYGGDYKLRSWLEQRLQPYVYGLRTP